MLPRATLTMVLSRKVRNSRVHSAPRATGRVAEPAPGPALRDRRTEGSVVAAADRGERGSLAAGVFEDQEPAEAPEADLPGTALLDGRPMLAAEGRFAAHHDRIRHLGLRRG